MTTVTKTTILMIRAYCYALWVQQTVRYRVVAVRSKSAFVTRAPPCAPVIHRLSTHAGRDLGNFAFRFFNYYEFHYYYYYYPTVFSRSSSHPPTASLPETAYWNLVGINCAAVLLLSTVTSLFQ